MTTAEEEVAAEAAALEEWVRVSARLGLTREAVEYLTGPLPPDLVAVHAAEFTSSPGTAAAGLPAPVVRVRRDPHSEPGARIGESWLTAYRVEVAAADYPSGLTDLRVELLRRRKQRTGRHGWQWVHPADHTGQTNPLSGARSRGGNQYDTDGALMVARPTSFPVTGPWVWTPVPLGPWFKTGTVLLADGNGTEFGSVSVPVHTGSKSSTMHGFGPPHLPRWKSAGGVLTARFAFRLSAMNPAGADPRDRVSGPVSAARVVARPVISVDNPGSPVWPDGAGGATGMSTWTLGFALEDQR